MATPRVFVSYSHENRQALERLQTFLKPLERDGLIDYWDDTRLQAGEDWQSAIQREYAEVHRGHWRRKRTGMGLFGKLLA